MPKIILRVISSCKNTTHKIIALTGSNALIIADKVEPMSFIDIVKASIEIIVGKIESKITQSHIIG